MLVLPLLALLFLALWACQHEAGWLIPTGILGGISLGILLPGDAFLSGFALGWFSIPLLTRVLTQETPGWALISSSLGWPLAETLLRGLGLLWPLALVVVHIAPAEIQNTSPKCHFLPVVPGTPSEVPAPDGLVAQHDASSPLGTSTSLVIFFSCSTDRPCRGHFSNLP